MKLLRHLFNEKTEMILRCILSAGYTNVLKFSHKNNMYTYFHKICIAFLNYNRLFIILYKEYINFPIIYYDGKTKKIFSAKKLLYQYNFIRKNTSCT